MEVEYAAKVIDRNGKPLGQVDHLVRNTYTGEITKFVVRQEAPAKDLFLAPGDVLEATETEVKLNITLEELADR